MTNTKLLRSKIEDSGIKIAHIARKLELSRVGLYNKLNNKSEFTAREIDGLSYLLRLTRDERDDIFFAKKVN